MSDQLTVIIPTSPIPSHPSTAILDETISNIRKYTNAYIIIMADGLHSTMKHRRHVYNKYLEAVSKKIEAGFYGACVIVRFEEHEHQARMTKKVLESVKTPLIMFCEHDCSPVGDIPFGEICRFLMWQHPVNYIRFNIFDRILEEHQHLMIDKKPIFVGVDEIEPVPLGSSKTIKNQNTIRLTRTIQWSQRPHIAKTAWYHELLNLYIKPTEKIMIEDALHGQLIRRYKYLKKDNFGLAIYTPEGNQLRSYHSDARGTDKKLIYG